MTTSFSGQASEWFLKHGAVAGHLECHGPVSSDILAIHPSVSSICFIRAQISPLTASRHPRWAKPLEKHRAQHERDATSFLVKCVACLGTIGNRNTAKSSSRKVIVYGLCGSSIGVAKRNQLYMQIYAMLYKTWDPEKWCECVIRSVLSFPKSH